MSIADQFQSEMKAAVMKSDLTSVVATRESAWDFYQLFGLLPDPDPVLIKLGGGTELLEQLMGDSHVISVVQTRKLGTLRKAFTLQAAAIGDDATDPRAENIAKMLNEDLESVDLHCLISQILDVPYYGIVPVEIMWKLDGGVMRIKGLRPLPARWFGFDVDNNPKFISKQNMWMGQDIPAGKFVFCRHFPSFDNPYGIRLLSRCYWPVMFKKGGWKFWARFLENAAGGRTIGKYANPADADKMLQQLQLLVSSGAATIPKDSDVVVLETNASGNTDAFHKFISACDASISKAIQGQTLTTEVGDKGTQALGTVHQDVLESYQESDQKAVAAFFEELAWVYAQVNDPAAVGGIEFAWHMEEDLQKPRADRDKILADTKQVEFTQQYIEREYGFEPGDVIVSKAPPPPAPLLPGMLPAADPAAGSATDPTAPAEPATTSTPTSPVAPSPTFAEHHITFPDQEAIDALVASIPPGTFQGLAEDAVKPVIEMISQGSDFNEVMGKLAETYPKMDTRALEEALARAIFVCEVWGRLHARSN